MSHIAGTTPPTHGRPPRGARRSLLGTALASLALVGLARAGAPATSPPVRWLDLDGDGRLDKLHLGAEGLAVSLNRGGGVFADIPQDLPAVDVAQVLVSDLDGDGLDDLYLVSPGRNHALLGDGAGRFREATEALGLADAGPGQSAERVDVDGDGRDDLLLHNRDGDVLFLAWGAGFVRDGLPGDGRGGVLPPGEPQPPAPTAAAGAGGGGIAPSPLGAAAGAPVLGVGGALEDGLRATGARATGSVDPMQELFDVFDERYVNDEANEVGRGDILDFSLTGRDVSTATGNVTMGGRLGVGTAMPDVPVHVVADSGDWAHFEQPGAATWELDHFSNTSLGIPSAMRLSIDGSPLDLYLQDEPGGLRAYLWEDNRPVPNLPHTGIKPTIALWGDILMGDIIAIERNPMTYFMRVEKNLPSTAVTNFFCASAINQDVDGGAGIVLAPDELGDVNSGYVSIVAYGQGTGQLANTIRFATRSGPNTTTDRMLVKGNGNVGIGTPDPVSRLHVAGDVTISGNLSKGGGSFQIDHPLDPENRTLRHSFVESPDMLNIYSGNVVLDGAGEAVVELPEWFEALNEDFRYQLTPLAAPAPGLFVAETVADNRFRIAGGPPGLTVSWQLSGVRHDPYALAHPIVVEEDKPADRRGTYHHPDVFATQGEPGAAAAGSSTAGS